MLRPTHWVAGCTLLLVAGIAVGTALLLRTRGVAATAPVQAQIGPAAVAYPAAYARFGPGRSGGRLDRVEMAFAFPDLRAAGDSAATTPSMPQRASSYS